MGTVYEATKAMFEANVASTVIIDNDGKLIGIVTERDLTRCVLAKGLDAKETRLEEVMTKNPVTISPDDLAMDALQKMCELGFRHLPIVDGERVVGMVSVRDLYVTVQEQLEDDMKFRDAYIFGTG